MATGYNLNGKKMCPLCFNDLVETEVSLHVKPDMPADVKWIVVCPIHGKLDMILIRFN